MSQKEIIEMLETSGTIKELSVKVSPPKSFLGSELTEKIDLNNITVDQHNKLKSILADIITSQSGVDGTP